MCRLARDGYQVRQNSPHTAIVTSSQRSSAQAREREVNLVACTCSCLFWQQRGFPCRHVIVFVQRKRGNDFAADADNWFASSFWPVYRTSSVLSTYDLPPVCIPILENVALDGRTEPPAKTKQRGAPRKKRIRSVGEGQNGRAGKPKRPSHCALCSADDHSKRTCPHA